MHIDKRKHQRRESMAMLEQKLIERAPRESLFELGILVSMSPAPSPPPLSVIHSMQYQQENETKDSIVLSDDDDYFGGIIDNGKKKKHKRNMTMELQYRMESKINSHPLANNMVDKLEKFEKMFKNDANYANIRSVC